MANSRYRTDALQDLRPALRLHELGLDRQRRKQFGQFFSGTRVASLLAALAADKTTRRVVDPMAGHGDLLEAAVRRHRGMAAPLDVVAVEIDRDTAKLAEQRLALCCQIFKCRTTAICADAFSSETWKSLCGGGLFDLVITNPPYVRYQATSGVQGADSESVDTRGLLDGCVQYTAEEEQQFWHEVVSLYSGLADLSVPSWILCSMLVKPGGTLALVVPRNWMTRDYARLLQYIQLRCFKPIAIVEEDGTGWFEDALVPTTLVVSRRLSLAEMRPSLASRAYGDDAVPTIAVSAQASNDVSLVGAAFDVADPEGTFVDWVRTGAKCPRGGLKLRNLQLEESRRMLLTRFAGKNWMKRLERCLHPPEVSVSVAKQNWIPVQMRTAFPRSWTPRVVPFEEAGLQVGQGLRTGCNEFFYVSVAGDGPEGCEVETSALLGKERLQVPIEVLQPVIRRQAEIPGLVVPLSLSSRAVVLDGWALPEDVPVRGNPLRTMPAALARLVRRAAKVSVARSGPPVPIPQLSAVRTNARRPTEANLFAEGAVHRFWYTLPPFAPRHRPLVFVPRVNHGTPWFVLNSSPPVLVDANFATIWKTGSLLQGYAALALFNSTWCRACAESVGTHLGAGALKLEATHIRTIPLPVLERRQVDELCLYGRALAKIGRNETHACLQKIDQVVLLAIFGADRVRSCQRVVAGLQTVIGTLRGQRIRK